MALRSVIDSVVSHPKAPKRLQKTALILALSSVTVAPALSQTCRKIVENTADTTKVTFLIFANGNQNIDNFDGPNYIPMSGITLMKSPAIFKITQNPYTEDGYGFGFGGADLDALFSYEAINDTFNLQNGQTLTLDWTTYENYNEGQLAYNFYNSNGDVWHHDINQYTKFGYVNGDYSAIKARGHSFDIPNTRPDGSSFEDGDWMIISTPDTYIVNATTYGWQYPLRWDVDSQQWQIQTEYWDGNVVPNWTIVPDLALFDPNADDDGDGVTNAQEIADGTDPNDMCDVVIANQTLPPSQAWLDADCDGDDLSNADEINIYNTDPLNADTDSDGLNDGDEITHGTDPLNPDSDGDGLTDGDEVHIYHTDPLNADTDGDGVTDGQEVADGTDPLDMCDVDYQTHSANLSQAWLDADCDGDDLSNADEINIYNTDPLNADTDGDGLNDGDEITHGTDPLNPDSDGDGLTDGDEVFIYQTDPNNPDTDGDGLNDGDEINIYNTDPLNADTDSDELNDFDEIFTYHTDPLNPDTDGDGVTDGQEVADGTDPNDMCDLLLHSQSLPPSQTWLDADCDEDGESNEDEIINGTDPLDPDSNTSDLQELSLDNFVVYPNPTDDFLTIKAGKNLAPDTKLVLIDQMGRVVMTQQIGDLVDMTLDMSKLSSGVYVLGVGTERFRVVRR